MRVTSGKSRVREIRLPGSVRAKPNGRATRPRSVLLFGNRKFASLAWHVLTHDSRHRIVGFTVDRAFMTVPTMHNLPVVPFEEVDRRFDPAATAMLLSVGWDEVNGLREKKWFEAKAKGFSFVSHTSSRAIVSPDLQVGDTSIVFDGVIVQPFATVGCGVILRAGCVLSHHVSVGDFVFVAAGAVISGGASIGRRAFMGLNATIRDDIKIGEGAVIGAGVTVNRDVPPGVTYASAPPRLIPSITQSDRDG